MKRQVRSSHGATPPGPPESLETAPDDMCITLDPAVNRCRLEALVNPGDHVQCGQCIAAGKELAAHAPLSGVVRTANDTEILIKADANQQSSAASSSEVPDRETLPRFAADMGLVGMGGSMFPSSVKFAAAQSVHTLTINAVECEPGIEIDMSLLLHEPEPVKAAVEMLKEALDIQTTVLAVRKASAAHAKQARPTASTQIHCMPNTYPAGAEKLIVDALDSGMPGIGELPVQRGYLVISVASLWAIGRRLLEGRPSMDRPLTLVASGGESRNVVVPIGTSVRHLLETYGIHPEPNRDILVAGGLMMGKQVDQDYRIQKGTNAIFVHRISDRIRKPEEPCVLCGSCFDVCPLGLHPISMADRIKARACSRALESHVQQCFLCGACSAVCPAEIPLVQYFHEGKQWLRERK